MSRPLYFPPHHPQTMNAETVEAYRKTSKGIDITPKGSEQWVMKVTPLGYSHEEADGKIMCIYLAAPCPTMEVRKMAGMAQV